MHDSIGNLCLKVFSTLLAGAAIAAAQTYGYVANELGNNVAVVNLTTNTVTKTISFSAAGVTGLAEMPDGAYVYVTEQNKNSVAILSTSSNSVTDTIAVGHAPVQVVFTPNGEWAYVVNSGSNNVSVINTSTKAVVATIPVGSKPTGIAVNPTGTEVLVTNMGTSNISVISTSTNKVTATWTALSGPSGIAVYGNDVYVANAYANSLTVYNLTTGVILYVTNGNSSSVWALKVSTLAIEAKIPAGLLPTAVAISSNSSTAYVTNGYGYSLTIINTATNTVKDTLPEIGVYPVSMAL